ncbi:MAG TPA: hypothetical protein VH590_04875 [Ktedonobacterales bacterium]
MKALDHYSKADRLEGQQAIFSAASFSEGIINLCHAAGHHLVCAGLEWQGVDPQSYGHVHSKHISKLKQVNAPSAVESAWGKLEQLRSRALYGGETSEQEALDARGHLAAIRAWAQSLHP